MASIVHKKAQTAVQPKKSMAVKTTSASSTTNSKSTTSSRNVTKSANNSAPKKPHHQLKKQRRVEILDPTKIENVALPVVKIQNETCRVDIEGRISKALGIQGSKSLGILDSPDEKVPVSEGDSDLNQPRFQSCQNLMKNLEKLRNVDVDAHNLLKIKIHRDKSVKESLNHKVWQ